MLEDLTPAAVTTVGSMPGTSSTEAVSLVVGEPIFGFLTHVRLQLAAHELATTAHSIETIAESAGYEAVNSFSRAFKRVFGKPPSVWRRKPRRRR